MRRSNLAQPLLAVEIVAVLRAIAVGGGPDTTCTTPGRSLGMSVISSSRRALEALRGHVSSWRRGQPCDLVGRSSPLSRSSSRRFLGEGLAHLGSCSTPWRRPSVVEGPCLKQVPPLRSDDGLGIAIGSYGRPSPNPPAARLRRKPGRLRPADGQTRLGDLYQRDPCRVLFPQSSPATAQAVLLTTSGA